MFKKQVLIKLINTMKLLITVSNRKYKMESYCVRCKKSTKNINQRVSGTSNGKAMISKCVTCGWKKSRFIKNQEAEGLLCSLGLKAPLSKVPVLGDICFESIKRMK